MRGSKYTFETGSRSADEIAAEIEAVVDQLDDDGYVDNCLDNVYWRPSGSTYSGAWDDNAPPGEIETPQVAKTSTEDHSYSGEARLYRRFDDEYVAVDVFRTLARSFWAIADYLAANYGLVPALNDGHYRLFESDRRLPGCHELPPEDPQSEREATLFAVLRDDRDDLSLEEAATLLDVDEYYHLSATKLPDAVEDSEIDRRVIEWLESDDPDLRARAVRWIGAVATRPTNRSWGTTPPGKTVSSHTPDDVPSIDGIDTFERFVRALPSVDATTQRLVARTLWEPWTLSTDSGPEREHVSALARLLDAESPEIRVGALHGAGRIFGDLVLTAETTDQGPDSLEALTPEIEAFYDAYVTALSDEHPVVRARAADLLTAMLAGEQRDGVFVVAERLLNEVPFDTKWDMARGLARLTEERDAIVRRLVNVEGVFERAFDGSPAAIDAYVSYGYEDRGVAWKNAREALATQATEDPTVLVDRIDPLLEAVEAGDVIPADLELLTELVSVAPDEVASVSDELAVLLDGSDEIRTEAAWTLHAIGTERPTAVEVDRATLVDVLADIYDEHGRPVPERLRRLAVVDPERASDHLAALADDVSRTTDGISTNRFATAVGAISEADPSVVARAAADVCDALSELRDYDYATYIGLARAAIAHPPACIDAVDPLVDALETDDELTREALATTLIAVGEHDRTALPSSLRPLCSRAEDAYDPDELARLADREGLSFSRDGNGPLDAIDDPVFGGE